MDTADRRLKKKLDRLDEDMLDEDESETLTNTTERLADAERKLAERGAMTATSTRTRERLAEAERKLAAISVRSTEARTETSTRTREKLADAERKLAATSTTRTSERLAEAERKLAERGVMTETSTRTRERLADAERKLAATSTTRTRERLADAERKLAATSTTRTRERLAEAERKLAATSTRSTREPTETSTRTRDKLADAERKLAAGATATATKEKLRSAEEKLGRMKVDAKTSTKTRDQLAKVEKEIEKARKKETSAHTLEAFKKKQELLAKLLDKNKNADFAFLVDCTGSMAGYINETKKQVQNIVSKVTDLYDNKVRVAFVGYRDHCDGPLRIESLGFTENIADFLAFVNNIKASGGGDAPEDVLGGLEAIVNLAWSSASKMVFHVGDSPQHGERFHDYGAGADNHYSVEPRGLLAEDLFKSMKHIGLKYFFGKVNSSTDKMFKVFQQLGGLDMVNPVDMSNPTLLESQAMASITATIESSLSGTVDFVRSLRVHGTGLSAVSEASEGGKTLKDYSISDVKPDIEAFTPLPKAHWLECEIGKLDDLKNMKSHIGIINQKWKMLMVKKGIDPFSEGAQRISYHGLVMNYAEGGGNKPVVLKEFKHFGHGRDRREDYIQIMETQCVAAFMAVEFNKLAPKGSKMISFITVSVVQVFDLSGSPKYYNVEPLLPEYAKFKKWNTNYGCVNIDEALIQAFSHWTHHITDGFLVVVDLQGIEREKEYGLTDPCINCKEPRFGSTNMGEVGINEFFRTHRCNAVCKTMGLKEKIIKKKGLFSPRT